MLLPRPRFRTAIVWALLGRIAERHRRPVQTSQAGPASQPDQLLTRGVREPPQDVHRDAIHRAVYGAADLLGLGISLERLRGRLSSLKLRLVRLLQTGNYALALHRPGRYRLFCVCGRLAGISHSGVDFRVAERERTGERPKKAAVVG